MAMVMKTVMGMGIRTRRTTEPDPGPRGPGPAARVRRCPHTQRETKLA